MAITLSSLGGSKTRYALTLTSGTSWTVPAGVTYVNVTLVGGGGSGSNTSSNADYVSGYPGQVILSTVATTPGASISYSIGAGGSGVAVNNGGNAGGTTTFTGATSAAGGNGGGYTGNYTNGTSFSTAMNHGWGGYNASSLTGSGGSGRIDIEYWV